MCSCYVLFVFAVVDVLLCRVLWFVVFGVVVRCGIVASVCWSCLVVGMWYGVVGS